MNDFDHVNLSHDNTGGDGNDISNADLPCQSASNRLGAASQVFPSSRSPFQMSRFFATRRPAALARPPQANEKFGVIFILCCILVGFTTRLSQRSARAKRDLALAFGIRKLRAVFPGRLIPMGAGAKIVTGTPIALECNARRARAETAYHC